MDFHEYSENIDFQKYWLTLKRHWVLPSCVWGLTVLGALTMAVTAKPTFEAQGKLLFKKETAASVINSSAENGRAKLGELDALGKDNTPLDTEAEVIRSNPVIQEAIAALGWKNDDGEPLPPGEFLANLQVKTVRGTDILSISYRDRNAQKAAAAVNQLMEIYIKENIRANRTEATAAREFISKQLPETETAVREIESNLRNFQETNRIVDLDQEAKASVGMVADLDSQIAKAKVQFDAVTARQAEIQSKLGVDASEALAFNALGQSAGVQQAMLSLQKVQEQLAVQRARFQDSAPLVAKLEEQQATLQALLQRRIEQVLGNQQAVPNRSIQIGQFQQDLLANLVNTQVDRMSLQAQIVSIDRLLFAYRDRAKLLPSLQQRQRDLTRQLSAAQSTYETLLKNLQQVQIAENQNVGNARIVSSAAIPTGSVSPNSKLFVLGGVVVGGLLYVVVAFLLELRDPSVKTVKEIRGLFGYPVLRLIPMNQPPGLLSKFQKKSDLPTLPVRDDQGAIASEAFKMLQTNLHIANPSQSAKVIAVTSSVSGEGRSTVAANLALATAQLGNRVVLIEADLRNPIQHKLWNLGNVMNLGDVVSDRSKLRMAIAKVTHTLDVLPAGSPLPDPLTLLNSISMQELLRDLKEAYDFVVIDTPPLLMVADGLVLGKLADSVLHVVRPGVIDAVSANATNDLLAQSNLPVLGLVVNGIRPSQEPESYFHRSKRYQNKPPKPPTSSPSSLPNSIPLNGNTRGSKVL